MQVFVHFDLFYLKSMIELLIQTIFTKKKKLTAIYWFLPSFTLHCWTNAKESQKEILKKYPAVY